MRNVAALAFASLGVVAVASCTLDFDSFDFIQFAAGGGGTGGTGVGGGCEPFCDQGAGGTGGSASGVGGEGTGGTGTGAGAGGMAGSGGGCNNPNQCPPGMDTDCAARTCDMGMCGLDLAAPGAPCNDNGGDVCDG
ncbi:MAG TPA: hypothetical protein ENK57_25935, partial [Polyangiaceae bacterium]|nr:hypothetical protein [Polyangiaceae bacterium]